MNENKITSLNVKLQPAKSKNLFMTSCAAFLETLKDIMLSDPQWKYVNVTYITRSGNLQSVPKDEKILYMTGSENLQPG